jgi:hypothetical protein
MEVSPLLNTLLFGHLSGDELLSYQGREASSGWRFKLKNTGLVHGGRECELHMEVD